MSGSDENGPVESLQTKIARWVFSSALLVFPIVFLGDIGLVYLYRWKAIFWIFLLNIALASFYFGVLALATIFAEWDKKAMNEKASDRIDAPVLRLSK